MLSKKVQDKNLVSPSKLYFIWPLDKKKNHIGLHAFCLETPSSLDCHNTDLLSKILLCYFSVWKTRCFLGI